MARKTWRSKTWEEKQVRAAIAAEIAAREVPVKAPACGGHCDTDNNGVCYTCGGNSPARDAGRII